MESSEPIAASNGPTTTHAPTAPSGEKLTRTADADADPDADASADADADAGADADPDADPDADAGTGTSRGSGQSGTRAHATSSAATTGIHRLVLTAQLQSQALSERPRLVLKEHFYFAGIDDARHHAISELSMPQEIALCEATFRGVRLELVNPASSNRLFPLPFMARSARASRRATRTHLAALGGRGWRFRAGSGRPPVVRRATGQALDLMRLSDLHRDDAVIQKQPAPRAPTVDFSGYA
jgi:hypothetical protein